MKPACINGHRNLMHQAVNRDVWICDECDYELPAVEWYRYLYRRDV